MSNKSKQDLSAMTPHEAASYWFVRHDAQGMTAEDRHEFESWLALSDEHRSTYEQTQSMWTGFLDRVGDAPLGQERRIALGLPPRDHTCRIV